MAPPLLEIRNLTVAFDTPAGRVHAVNDLSYTLNEGETLGVVGESGSGKSVHVLAMLGLLPSPPAKILSGEVLFQGRDLLKLPEAQLRELRGGQIGMVFQDPMSSLNPVLTVGRQLREVIERHSDLRGAKAEARATELLDLVGIPNPGARLKQYPHEFSGGMRQRVMIAIGLSCNPKLLIADEATTALDVTVQAQILDLVRDLKDRLGTTVIWITHDMGVVAELADTIQVMYGGRIMERGPVRAVFRQPHSAYTWGLLRSLPDEGARAQRRLYQIPGAPPDMANPPAGDPFAPRNPYATDRCRTEVPPLRPASPVPGHMVAAWYDLPARLAAEAAHG
ncbi:ATP-binding cassette domain-containing protein [Frigidibacter albus]|uniref:ATP-binding cassette domain-containing protein n=1 Tax=Frigidibacter albus TaxID=1465486 RepID=A0A6L8VHK9_9RHOB|nr:ABC transporter ATP-binding protein [Frigidibacter albus]MZQ89186.1 ATP-binding cassette domain-containing protein [Frigidibacter albus]NBE30757.1 ATP-binding cassette domain-containing protein [Frigidibacter albus]GGH50882.1 ABC transporter ATP-binding protein [Frigidibacter albus]